MRVICVRVRVIYLRPSESGSPVSSNSQKIPAAFEKLWPSSILTSVTIHFTIHENLKKRMETQSFGSFSVLSQVSQKRKNNKGCQHKECLCVASSNVTSVDTHFTRQANLKKRMETESSGSFALISSLSTSAHLNAHFIFTRQANLKKRKKNNKGCQHKEHPCVQQTRTQLTPSLRRTCPLTGEKNLLSTTIYSRALVRKLIAKYGLQSFLFQSTKLGMIILVVH